VVARRIEQAAGSRPIQLVGLPSFKPTDAYAFPLALDRRIVARQAPDAGTSAAAPVSDPRAAVVVLCDSLFVVNCGGPAEDAAVADTWPVAVGLFDRWSPAAGRTLSVYLPRP
jgi:hypothetical protein